MERSNYGGAIQSFERAQAQMRHDEGRSLLVISLVGFLMAVLQRIEITCFDRYPGGNLIISTPQFGSVCEAWHAAGRTKDAVECFHQMTAELGGDVVLYGEDSEWVNEWSRTCRRLRNIFCQISVREVRSRRWLVGVSG